MNDNILHLSKLVTKDKLTYAELISGLSANSAAVMATSLPNLNDTSVFANYNEYSDDYQKLKSASDFFLSTVIEQLNSVPLEIIQTNELLAADYTAAISTLEDLLDPDQTEEARKVSVSTEKSILNSMVIELKLTMFKVGNLVHQLKSYQTDLPKQESLILNMQAQINTADSAASTNVTNTKDTISQLQKTIHSLTKKAIIEGSVGGAVDATAIGVGIALGPIGWFAGAFAGLLGTVAIISSIIDGIEVEEYKKELTAKQKTLTLEENDVMTLNVTTSQFATLLASVKESINYLIPVLQAWEAVALDVMATLEEARMSIRELEAEKYEELKKSLEEMKVSWCQVVTAMDTLNVNVTKVEGKTVYIGMNEAEVANTLKGINLTSVTVTDNLKSA
ncbi:hypothetical protein J8L98_17675 [Pseudoalteromonas sp. MMG013]|uniref:hypothetical protein n=1 Tax=Pseudoalteromonas sp. MMG013 TaxID=2822687 RepID=UPI001B3962D1|nr:hypothetical protein [Pseudoalteromonas sp. MMG013]MBQ4863514.1 hypothetical protein [Pseudoalteromonas sp. MMG013]